MREYAEIKQRTQTNWNVLGRTRADFRRHSREHQSSISVYWPQDDEFAVTRMSTALTRSKLMLSQAYYEHFASSPIQCSPLTRRDQSSRKWKNKCPNVIQIASELGSFFSFLAKRYIQHARVFSFI
ncbi:PREDICTED: uncharacterized protein LOC108752436 [Trachymyrmex septentrionalis]|uniref:uncharacterized protein LOC108752436 n=1 Tax=Trachymyrmex septentrionalis TaxID=34720 RepID=UPI00084F751B|nr:PREDICTED: uncharacterized protein LOC108752436 [Trachymyrmex septentrionalis]